MGSLTGFLFLMVLVPLLAGGVALVRGRQRLGVGLLALGALPVVLVLVAALLVQWRGTYFGPASQPLTELFKAPVPASVRIVNFRGDAFGMDPSFWWECTPLDEGYLAALKKSAGLTRSTEQAPAAALGSSGPTWWNPTKVEALSELYFSDSGEGGLRRVWVDRKNNRLFLCFLGH